MGKIVRCPACATLFRVSAEQLAIAHGWARCGQCGEVFDAGLHLLAEQAVSAERNSSSASPEVLTGPPSPASSPASAPPDAAGQPDPIVVSPDHPAMAAMPAPPPQMPIPAVQEPEAMPEVDFVRATRQPDFWALPLVRAALGMVCLTLFAGLLVQLAIGQKDALAAQEPRLAPALQAACRLLGCEVRPLRRIESLVIEQAGFSKTGLDAYRLAFVFRNTGDAAVEVPALELTLTDNLDQAVLRRVIMPAQFAAGTVTLAAYSELAGALSLKVAGAGSQAALPTARSSALPVASYRILAFYP